MNKVKTFLERKNVKSFPEKTDTSIDILNDDCLEHVFKFLPIVDRIRSENGKYSKYYVLRFSHFSK